MILSNDIITLQSLQKIFTWWPFMARTKWHTWIWSMLIWPCMLIDPTQVIIMYRKYFLNLNQKRFIIVSENKCRLKMDNSLQQLKFFNRFWNLFDSIFRVSKMFRKFRVTLFGFGYNCHFVWFCSVSMTRCQIYYYRILEISQKIDFVTQMCLSDISIWLVLSDLNTLASFWKLKFRFFHFKIVGLRLNIHHRTLFQWKFMKFIDLSLTLSSYSRFVRFESTEHLKTTSSLWILRNCWVHLPLFCIFTSVEEMVKILIHVIPLCNIRRILGTF